MNKKGYNYRTQSNENTVTPSQWTQPLEHVTKSTLTLFINFRGTFAYLFFKHGIYLIIFPYLFNSTVAIPTAINRHWLQMGTIA